MTNKRIQSFYAMVDAIKDSDTCDILAWYNIVDDMAMRVRTEVGRLLVEALQACIEERIGELMSVEGY